jgi:hypothetical protein
VKESAVKKQSDIVVKMEVKLDALTVTRDALIVTRDREETKRVTLAAHSAAHKALRVELNGLCEDIDTWLFIQLKSKFYAASWRAWSIKSKSSRERWKSALMTTTQTMEPGYICAS